MTSCVIMVAGFTNQSQPSGRRVRWLTGVDHVCWLMSMHKQSLTLPNTLSPNYKLNDKKTHPQPPTPQPQPQPAFGSDTHVCANWWQTCISHYFLWKVSYKSHGINRVETWHRLNIFNLPWLQVQQKDLRNSAHIWQRFWPLFKPFWKKVQDKNQMYFRMVIWITLSLWPELEGRGPQIVSGHEVIKGFISLGSVHLV